MAANYFDKLCKILGSSTIWCTINFPEICLLHTVFLYKSRNIKAQLLVNIIAIAPQPLTLFCPKFTSNIYFWSAIKYENGFENIDNQPYVSKRTFRKSVFNYLLIIGFNDLYDIFVKVGLTGFHMLLK